MLFVNFECCVIIKITRCFEDGIIMIRVLLHKFMDMVEGGQIEVYNEFSLQHELGIFLRERLSDYKVQFERNTKYFGISGSVKHEIDIVIFNDSERCAVELKYPMNGQYPEQMYSFVKDIAFMEQLKDKGFDATYCLTMVNDKNFYSGKKTDGIYAFFRDNRLLSGTIGKPTGKVEEAVTLKRAYKISWEGKTERLKYYIVEINKDDGVICR